MLHAITRYLRLIILLALLTGCSARSTMPAVRATGVPSTAAPAVPTGAPASAALATGSTTTASAATPQPQLTPPAEQALLAATPGGLLRVHFIDIGQGDSILLQAPDGATALIDGGNGGSGALAYLQAQGITSLDVMVASHPHADHIGGLIDVLGAIPVGAVWTSGASHSTGTFERFLDAIADARVPYYEAARGQGIPFGTLRLVALHSDPQAAELNDTSLVLRLDYGAVSFLFTGDAERHAEDALLEEMADQLAATVLKVGHHGSATSSSPAFLAAVQPEIAVYSAGSGNSYGHPHRETVAQLAAVGAVVYGTDNDGTIVIETDGDSATVTTQRQMQPADIAAPLPSAVTTPMEPVAPVTPEPAEAPNTPLRYDPQGPDRDCGDFASHVEAQAFFVAAGGPARDPHRLDGDNDGVACERLP